MTKRYGLSALGVICALGHDKQQVWENWLAGSCAQMRQREDLIPGRSVRVGEVGALLPACDPRFPHWQSRNLQLLEAAYQEIASEVETAIAQFGQSRIAVVLGTSTSGVAETEAAMAARQGHGELPERYNYAQQEMGTPALYLQAKLGLTGPAYCVSTACSSSAKVFASARALLDAGLADAVLVGGVDSLCQLTLCGFNALESVSEHDCQPFGAARDGINIGEGAALFLMSAEEAEVNLVGVGESSDAHHMSAPHPDGIGAEQAIRAALTDAGHTAAEVDYINLHGTATRLNDAMEAKVVARVFGPHTPCSSTKRQTGHALGAAGAIEAALSWLLLSSAFNPARQLPPMTGDYPVDPALEPIDLIWQPRTLKRLDLVLSQSFAFGGSNAVICLQQGRE